VKNITLALDDKTYRRARIRAAERNMSVSALVKQLLTEEAAEERAAGSHGLDPRKEFLTLAAELRALSAGRSHTPAEVLQRESRDQR
jgi:plasmid stability protein